MLNHKGSKTIETDRLILRQYRSTDAELMFRNWASDREVTKFLTWNAHRSISDTEAIINLWVSEYNELSRYNWIIVLKETGEPIGSIDVCHIHANIDAAEIGYCIGKAHWGKGIMTEAFKAVIKYLFEEIGFNQVRAAHAVKNPASGKVMEKCGLALDGTFRQFFRATSGELLDISYRSILREDYFADKEKSCNDVQDVI